MTLPELLKRRVDALYLNLQVSENYAFGDTFQKAIDNYGKLYE